MRESTGVKATLASRLQMLSQLRSAAVTCRVPVSRWSRGDRNPCVTPLDSSTRATEAITATGGVGRSAAAGVDGAAARVSVIRGDPF